MSWDTGYVAGLSPVPGFHTAAVFCMIAYMSTWLLLRISHRGTAMGIDEQREVVAVNRKEHFVTAVVASLELVAALATNVVAAAVLG